MANYYNINRSLEAYELRLIDPDDGQLKSIFDIPSIGSSGQGGYTDLEIDNLVNAKLNIDNPDVNGTLRAGAGGSGGKIIINSGSTPESESFYVNGLSTFNGTVKVPMLDASSNIKTTQEVQTNTFNTSAINTKISFNDNENEYMKYENSVVDATFNGLKVLDNLYTMDIYPQSIRLPYNNKISFIDTNGATDTDYYNDNYINITIDGGIQRINQVIMANGEHRFYCGDIATADDGDLVMKLSNTRIDIYKDLYLNDTLFQQGGGGGGNSGAFSEDVVIADTYQLKTDTISSNGLNDLVFNVDTLGEFLRFQISDNTVRVPNNRSFLSQTIYSDLIQPLAFGNDVVFNGGNSTNDAYEEYVRLDASAEKVSISKETKFENNIQFNVGQNISWTNVFIREVFSSRPEFDLIVNGSTSHMRMWVAGAIRQAITNTTIACKVNIDAEQGLTVFTGQQLKTNTINSHTNSNLVIQRSGSTYMTFQSDRININQALHLSDTLFIDTVNKLSLKPSLDGGVNIFDIRNLHPVADNPMIRFRVGEGGGETIICEMTNNGVSIARNLVVGTAYELRTNALDTNGDNDLVFQRNGTEIFKCETSAGIDNNNILNVSATGGGVSAVNVYGNSFKNRTLTSDTVFYGANPAGDNRIEYMKWNRADQSLDFNAPIDNTNISVIGNIIDTTVSDERLKTNIKDVESNYCDCIKNVKIKTFDYKDEKYKDSDKYGMIAQDLLSHLPKELKNIVRETKPKKDEGEAYLSINYMKLSVVLWGALQETLTKVDHLEASVYELQEAMKEFKKPKAKAKAKAKN